MRPLVDKFEPLEGNAMVLPVRALLVSAAIVAAFGPLAAVHAQEIPDATAAALMHWRTAALSRVDPSMHDAVAAMYADQPVDLAIINPAAAAKQVAEQAALIDLSKAEQVQIESYFAQVMAESTPALGFRDTTD